MPCTPRYGGGTVALRLARCLKPVIAAINGAAVGVGITMTLPMDIRLASSTARFGFVFARRGIVTEAASSWSPWAAQKRAATFPMTVGNHLPEATPSWPDRPADL